MLNRMMIQTLRAAVITFGFAITLGFLFSARGLWSTLDHRSYGFCVHLMTTIDDALTTAPFTIMMSVLFAFLPLPLASWAIGATRWALLKRRVFMLWSALAVYILIFGESDGVILISGFGLISLWFLRQRGSASLDQATSAGACGPTSNAEDPSRHASIMSGRVAVLVLLILVTSAVCLYLFTRSSAMIQYVEIGAVYFTACVCQGVKVFLGRKDR